MCRFECLQNKLKAIQYFLLMLPRTLQSVFNPIWRTNWSTNRWVLCCCNSFPAYHFGEMNFQINWTMNAIPCFHSEASHPIHTQTAWSTQQQQQHHCSKSIAWNVMSNYIQCSLPARPVELSNSCSPFGNIDYWNLFGRKVFAIFLPPPTACHWCYLAAAAAVASNSETDEKQKWWLGK